MESPNNGNQVFVCIYNWTNGFPWCGSLVQNPTTNAGDEGSIPGLGRSPGEENGNLLQCSCLENPMVRGAWWVVKELHETDRLNNNNDCTVSPTSRTSCLDVYLISSIGNLMFISKTWTSPKQHSIPCLLPVVPISVNGKWLCLSFSYSGQKSKNHSWFSPLPCIFIIFTSYLILQQVPSLLSLR